MDTQIEPYLIKAISLLHSRAKDSGDQLKTMLDEAIRQRSEGQSAGIASRLPPPLTNMIKKEGKKKAEVLYEEDIPLSKRRKESPRSSAPASPARKEKASKRKYEIFNDDDSSSTKMSRDSPSSSQPSSPGRSPHGSCSASRSPTGGARRSDDSDSLIDADDLAQDLMDLHCVVCKGLDVASGNQLVECQDCHGLYHQECHQPAISDAEFNDPRQVWYCSSCAKSMKKTPGRPKSNSSRDSPIVFRGSRCDSPGIAGGGGKQPATCLRKDGSKLENGTKWAGSSGSSSGSSSSSSVASGSSNALNPSLINADKRLQIIKKRAATKMSEKRKISK